MIDSKENIICAVADLFLKYGIRSVSMDDIAHHMGISKKTIYQHFADKNDLVEQVAGLLIKQRMCEYDDGMKNAGNAIEELFAVSKLVRKHFTDLNPALLYDVQKYYPKAWEQFIKYENDVVYHSVVDNIERGIAEGYFRPEINARVLARIRVEQIHVSFDERVFPKDQYDFKEVQIQLFDHYVHGLLTHEGLALYRKYQKQNDE